MKLKVLILASMGFLMLLTSSCTSGVEYRDSKSNDGLILSRDKLDHQDFSSMAEKMANSLVSSLALNPINGKKPVIMIGRIKNETEEHIQTDLIMRKIEIVLLNSGRAEITAAVDADGVASGTKTVRSLKNDDDFKKDSIAEKGELIAPDYRIQGQIIQTNARSGVTKQNNFTLQLELVYDKDGKKKWIQEDTIIKIGPKSGRKL